MGMKRMICAVVSLTFAFSGLYAEVNSSFSGSSLVTKADEQDYWIDFAAESFAGGEGTAESPYIVQTAEQLAKIAKEVYDGLTDYNDTWFILKNDLDLAGHEWMPIGVTSSDFGELYFGGKFNGNGHKILNLDINMDEQLSTIGLFGLTTETFELRNLIIESGEVVGTSIVGALVGRNRGIVENCINKAKVSCSLYYVGGIVGSNSNTQNAVVRNCQNYGEITAGYDAANGLTAGGIAGLSSSLIEKCVNYGSIEAYTSGAGGIVGILEGGTVRHCINRGSLTSIEQVGGVIGAALGRTGDCEVYNCYSAAELTSDAGNGVGGVIGVAMFPSMNKLRAVNSYFDFNLFVGQPCGYVSDFLGNFVIEKVEPKHTADMKNAEFVELLNSESEGDEIWLMDEQNINDGYPVLEFMGKEITGIAETVENDVVIKVVDSCIILEGVENDSLVKLYSVNGFQVFSGVYDIFSSMRFDRGIYLLNIGNATYKVFVD